MALATRIDHRIDPVFDERSRVLVLGTMPSPLSREVGFYYGNPRNRFWPVMAALLGEPVPEGTDARRDLCLRHGIALWDVLASCVIEGASDSSIREPIPNDISRIVNASQVTAVFCTGGTATHLYRRLVEPKLGLTCTGLPSTSPANARMDLDALIAAYAPITRALLPQ